MSKPVFPSMPFNGQQYTDQFGVRWIYRIDNDAWFWIGPVIDYQIAKSGNNCKEE